jgi:hypothetical protein
MRTFIFAFSVENEKDIFGRDRKLLTLDIFLRRKPDLFGREGSTLFPKIKQSSAQ